MKDLERIRLNQKVLGLIGIATTKLNARVIAGMFNKKDKIPNSLEEIKKELKTNRIVICGALGFSYKTTTDGNAAEIARYLKARALLNITNVDGLYNKDPRRYKDARIIARINFTDFNKIVNKINYRTGQHFVLDQRAANVIKKSRIQTIILNGHKLKNLKDYLDGKKYTGTVIE